MSLLLLLLLGFAAVFGGVLWFGAPYLPTLTPQVKTALDMLDLRPGQTLLELGCGDGKVLIAAAERGCQAVGIELNPLLALAAWLRTRKYRGRVRVIWGNFWTVPWPREIDAVFTFLLDPFMKRLDDKMVQYKKPLASVAFRIPGRQPAQQQDGVFLYKY